MPRVRSLIREDPIKTSIREEIYGILGSLKISQAELARLSGIKSSTLSARIGKHGNIGDLRLDEYLRIKQVAEKWGSEG